MSTDKAGFVSVGAEIEDEVMPDRVVFSICFGGSFDTKEACLDDYDAEYALRSLRHWHPLVWMAS